jgi:hypothetical protein
MITEPYRTRVIQYITERRCPDGGFCFYRLNEPNAADTYYTVSSLTLLGEHFNDDLTVSYLIGLQRKDGTYPTIYVGYYTLKSLATLGIRPRIDPDTWIETINPFSQGNERPPESSSYFETCYLYTDLCRTCGIPVPATARQRIIRDVTTHQLPDSGFGIRQSTLTETWHALAILSSLGFDGRPLVADRFLSQCEDAELGFLAVPGSKSSFLEHLYAGIKICSLLGYSSWVLPRCREILTDLQTGNGGFVRSRYGGSATLEYTFLAVSGFEILSSLTEMTGKREYSHTDSHAIMEAR